ncbi:MAG TPA: response regulator [Burkholderiaceae bacterium]|jgi:DNA-binding NtrC family response regulator|nr:response regulator [Burkholderiaceae bacterium]
MAEILVVDDEIGIRELLSEILGDEGHTVHVAESAQQARDARDSAQPDLVLLDIWMPDTDGVTLLKEWAAGGKLTMPVIMMSGHATIDTAVEATRIGALDFLEKPIALQKLLKAVEQGLARGRTVGPPKVAPQVYQVGAANTSGKPGITMLPVGGNGQTIPLSSPAAQFLSATSAGAMSAVVAVRDLPLDLPLREARDAFERAYFEHHLSREHGSMTRVAEKTGLERTHLYRKLKQLGIDLSKGAYRKSGGHSAQ